MELPNQNGIPVNLLAACFNKTSATYKYYWLISIIQEVENGNLTIFKRDLFARMLSNAWFTVNYFHVSFGKQDSIQTAIRSLKLIENISIEENQKIIYQKLSTSRNISTQNQLRHFNNNVPHWFLSPWFPGKNKTEIYNASKVFSQKCLYALHSETIVINPEWRNYLTLNARMLKDFCYWNLSLYLQTKNPNVPDIPNKLIKPAVRNSLTRQRNKFWNLVVANQGSIKCIFTGEKLEVGGFDLDHFIPYNFVSHDLNWNLIPIYPPFNSIKSDKLPSMDKYFQKFFELQNKAVKIIKAKMPNNKLLEDYLTIFPNLEKSFTKDKYKESIQPLITIASNNGFEFMK